MTHRMVTRLTTLVALLAASGCSSSSTGFGGGSPDSGTHVGDSGSSGVDSSTGGGDDGGQSDTGTTPLTDSGTTPSPDATGAPDAMGNPGDGEGGTYDFGCGTVSNMCNLSQVCCAMPGATTTYGCVAPTACSVTNEITCDGPDECTGTSTPVCCGVEKAKSSGTGCVATEIGTSCTTAAACATHIAASCTDTTRVQLCHLPGDCSDPATPKCCTFVSNGASLTFCTDQLTALAGMATCH